MAAPKRSLRRVTVSLCQGVIVGPVGFGGAAGAAGLAAGAPGAAGGVGVAGVAWGAAGFSCPPPAASGFTSSGISTSPRYNVERKNEVQTTLNNSFNTAGGRVQLQVEKKIRKDGKRGRPV